MSTERQTEFCRRIEEVVDHFRLEWELTYCKAIGCLALIKARLEQEALDDE